MDNNNVASSPPSKKTRSKRKEGGNTPISAIAESSLDGGKTSEEKKAKGKTTKFSNLENHVEIYIISQLFLFDL